MADITYDKLAVGGVDYVSIEDLAVIQAVNEHAKAAVSMMVDADAGKKYMNHTHEGQVISISAEGKTLFCGLVQRASLSYEKNYPVLTLELISASILWDLQRRNKSYQCIGKSYTEIMQQATEGNGFIQSYVPGKSSEAMVVQYQETTWQFILRLAAYQEAPVFVDPTKSAPTVKIGVSGANTAGGNDCAKGGNGSSGETSAVMALGSGKGSTCIKYIKTVMEHGILKSYYSYASQTSVIPKYHRPAYIGKIFPGVVQNVSKADIQVWIPELDESFDGSGNTWFPYSTAYSTEVNEAGIYCMPAAGDPVRVFLPTEGLKDIFASSGPSVRGFRADKEERCIQTPEGMSILFGKEGLTISCKDSTTFIDLRKDGSIAVASNRSIGVLSKTNVYMSSMDGVVDIEAGDSVELVTPGSYVGLSKKDGKGNVDMFAKQIYIGLQPE